MDESQIFHILGNDRRREIIDSLADRDEPMTLSELATEIATREADGSPSDDLYKSVYVSLQQTHLPKMTYREIVRYDRDRKIVEPGPRLDEIAAYVEEQSTVSEPLAVAPIAVSFLAIAVIVTALAGVPVVSAVGVATWAILFFLLVIATTSLWHW